LLYLATAKINQLDQSRSCYSMQFEGLLNRVH